MSKYTLTVVDTSGIQNYVFGTNNLKQIVGASYLVDCATHAWAIEAIPCTHNVNTKNEKIEDKRIEKKEVEAEVVYAGGGNTVILFSDLADAKEFTRQLSRKVLLEAPGLNIVVVHHEFDWDTQTLGGAQGMVQAAMSSLAERKANPPPNLPYTGLGVTVECPFTGKPAVEIVDNVPYSAEALAKLKAEPKAFDRMKNLIQFKGFDQPPRDFDQLGQSPGEKSYIAVIHTDGNRMGERVAEISNRHDNAGEGNRAYITAMRAFSVSVQEAATRALQSTVDLLIDNIDSITQSIKDVIKITGKRLPFRPIVFGGDDVTFVCDGRIGLDLTAHYLAHFSNQKLSDEENAHCRAGVAVVHTHFPFSRAYAFAEELCQSSKAMIKAHQPVSMAEPVGKTKPVGMTAMDWHFATSGIIHSLEETRETEYLTSSGCLLMRPVALSQEVKTWRTWHNFQRAATEFQSGKAWVDAHNKVKSLRKALRSGENSVKNFLALYKSADKELALPEMDQWDKEKYTAWAPDGKGGCHCGYFDAVEAVDHYLPLIGVGKL